MAGLIVTALGIAVVAAIVLVRKTCLRARQERSA